MDEWKASNLPIYDFARQKFGVRWCGFAIARALKKAFSDEYETLKKQHHATAIKRTYNSGKLNNKGIKNPKAKYLKMTEQEAREIFEDYKRQNLDLLSFCHKRKLGTVGVIGIFRKYFLGEYEAHIETKMGYQRNYRKGRDFEYRTRNLYQQQGYFVLRSPRSLGLVDLVAIKKGEILLIQCKMSGKLELQKRIELIKLAESIGAKAVLAFRNIQHKIETKNLKCSYCNLK